jgi:hypothetical protein
MYIKILHDYILGNVKLIEVIENFSTVQKITRVNVDNDITSTGEFVINLSYSDEEILGSVPYNSLDAQLKEILITVRRNINIEDILTNE